MQVAPTPRSPNANTATSLASALSNTRALASSNSTRSRDVLEPSPSAILRRQGTVQNIGGSAKASPLVSFTATSSAAWFVDPDDPQAAQANSALVAVRVNDKFELDGSSSSNAPNTASVAVGASSSSGSADVALAAANEEAADAGLTEEHAPASRLVDYVLLVGVRDDDIGAAALQALGSQDQATLRAPDILQQYPPLPRADAPLSTNVAQFCLPEHEPTCVIATEVPSGAGVLI